MSPTTTQQAPATHDRQSQPQPAPESELAALHEAIEHAAHLLPAQGPITVFIHHNTLHAFEDLPFTTAVEKGARTFGCQPYLSEDRYQAELTRGRIRFSDLHAVLKEDLGVQGDRVLPLGTRLELRLAMLQYPLRFAPTEELLWYVAETDALRRVRNGLSLEARARLISETRRWVMRDLRGGNEASRNGAVRRQADGAAGGSAERQAAPWLPALFARFGEARIEDWDEETWEAFALQSLWRVCCDGVAGLPEFAPPPPRPMRHRDYLLEATGEDTDLAVHEVLIRFCAAFLDQGLAPWQLPERDLGFFGAFAALYGRPGGPPERWRRALGAELASLRQRDVMPLESLRESLEALGVPGSEWPAYLSATLLALPGWAGMIHQVELRGDRVRQPIPRGSLVEFLAVRLLMERFALAQTAQDTLGYTGPLRELRHVIHPDVLEHTPRSIEQRAFLVFHLAQLLGWTPPTLFRLRRDEWATMVEEIETFTLIERRRIFHLAYERRFVTQSLDVMALHAWTPRPTPGRARFQACFCLDEREESMRRHLEEVAPDVETFGAAGFYGMAMYYRGTGDAHFVPLCPIIIVPKQWVREEVDASLVQEHQRRARARRALGTASHRFHVGSRSFTLGAVLTASLGVLASIPLVARVLFPRLTARIRRLFGRFVQAPPDTRLRLERREPTAGPDGDHVGYTLDEMIDIGERQLRDLGLTSNLAPLVFLIGHGSISLNNPHKSAYDCGACGGAPGAPNGRALAQVLNDPRVRERLAGRGIDIPADTVFVGGLHNTCNDSITFYDLDRVPEAHRGQLEAARRDFDAALDRNAHERCRRFELAPLTLSFAAAHEHVEARSEDLAQTRPELGHATNTLCLVGRRERTRGLFFDRRAFLTTYDPTKDDANGSILTRLLQAAVPVCSGINLEYYFSRVDNSGFGCGTKLPHNVSALLGVMDGAASDLRTGLPWQMVEIHEPVRLLFVIETTPEIILRIMDKQPGIAQVFRHGWSFLTIQDPHTGKIQVFRDGAFHPYTPEAEHLPQASSSVDWYRGWRDHLEFAEIR